MQTLLPNIYLLYKIKQGVLKINLINKIRHPILRIFFHNYYAWFNNEFFIKYVSLYE